MSAKQETADAEELSDKKYGTLMNVARSVNEQFDADIDTDAPKKDEVAKELAEVGVEVDGEEFMKEGEEVNRLESQYDPEQRSGSSEEKPQDKTILYGLTRAATTEQRIEEIADALEPKYEVQEAAGGDKYSIVLPAENNPDQAHLFEDEEAEGEESEEKGESEAESEEKQEADQNDGDSESNSEPAESDSEGDEQDFLYAVLEDQLAEKSKKEIYEQAKKLGIDGRSDMTKGELISAVAEEHPKTA
ncbi:MAG: Rho termination factor N-terminal domain-containing protein [Halobacteria archaeon]